METIPGPREAPAQGLATAAGFWALVLAAGAGSRFGGDKLRARWGDGTLIEASLTVARAAPVEGVMVLTRPGDRLIDDPGLQGPAVQTIEVADWAEGMGATLRAGIAALPPTAAGVYVFLGDMPRIPLPVLAPLAEAVRAGAPAAAPVFADRIGHPVLFSSALFPKLLALTGDRGARRLLETLGNRLVMVTAPDGGVLFDVDTPGDLDRSGRIKPVRAAQ